MNGTSFSSGPLRTLSSFSLSLSLSSLPCRKMRYSDYRHAQVDRLFAHPSVRALRRRLVNLSCVQSMCEQERGPKSPAEAAEALSYFYCAFVHMCGLEYASVAKRGAPKSARVSYSPPAFVHVAWREHILDTEGYASFCEESVGFFIHRQPDDDTLQGHIDRQVEQVRYTMALRCTFGISIVAVMAEHGVWYDDLRYRPKENRRERLTPCKRRLDRSASPPSREASSLSRSSSPSRRRRWTPSGQIADGAESESDLFMQVHVKNLKEETIVLTLRPSHTVRTLMDELIVRNEATNEDPPRLAFCNKLLIIPEMSLRSCRITSDSVLRMVPSSTLRHLGDEAAQSASGYRRTADAA
ncbi:hypothetical protein CYMTET_37040 [Cymbomonas tetramitiformis]|uniref:Ubiquitin-like domain-containing protein n=1 Tax=Cymbomonas tetramitiformis TaxID=36881 RepID=A0AAE0F7Q2_9CHLO|nr:hypothetical protein CYMTET_37040 [Cymbomonas tetramitiformis]